VLGVSAEAHILSWFRPVLDRRLDADSRQLSRRIGRRVRLAGMLEARRTAPTRSGQEMLFLTFDDEWGLFEVTVFPDAARPMRSRLDGYGPYVIAGVVDRQHGCVTVTADRITLWDAPEVVAIAGSA
jgi:DNA polymerase III alpha subunit